MSVIGFVGLGTMGGRIAGRLLASGHDVHATNRTVAKAQPLIDRGLWWHATPREVAAAADIVFSMVSDGYGERDIAAFHQVLGRLGGTATDQDEHPTGEPALARA